MRYSASSSPFNRAERFLHQNGAPITTGLLAFNAATMFISFLVPAFLGFLVKFVTIVVPMRAFPWTFVTYPVAHLSTNGNGFVTALFLGFLFMQLGGSVERSWGSRTYAIFLAATSLITSASLFVASPFAHNFVPLYGFYIPLACCTIAFATLNPAAPMSIWFIPMQAKYFGIAAVIVTWFELGANGAPFFGLIGCSGLLASYLYVRYGRSWRGAGAYTRSVRRGPDLYLKPNAQFRTKRTLDGSPINPNPFDIATRYRAWQEHRRLEKLLKNSGYTGDEPTWRNDDNDRRS